MAAAVLAAGATTDEVIASERAFGIEVGPAGKQFVQAPRENIVELYGFGGASTAFSFSAILT